MQHLLPDLWTSGFGAFQWKKTVQKEQVNPILGRICMITSHDADIMLYSLPLIFLFSFQFFLNWTMCLAWRQMALYLLSMGARSSLKPVSVQQRSLKERELLICDDFWKFRIWRVLFVSFSWKEWKAFIALCKQKRKNTRHTLWGIFVTLNLD